MAISIDWGAKIINVPRADMTLLQSVPTEIRQLDLNAFRLELKDLEDDVDGAPYLDTHRHNTTVEVGGVILARVVEIINGYTVTFENGMYAVNLTGANSNVGDVVNVNQVSVRSANSAGLQDLSTLLAGAYDHQVCISSTGQTGTNTPLGTRGTPVNNFADALAIAQKNSIRIIQIMDTMTLDTTDFSAGYTFRGDSAVTCTLTVLPGAQVDHCSFDNLTVQGTMDGEAVFERCNILDIDYTNGFVYQCALNGIMTIAGGTQCSLLDCFSNVAGGGPGQTPVIDMGGSGNSLVLRNYSGGIALRQYSGGGNISLDMASGRVILESTVTSGTITVRGIADLEDNSTGTAVLVDSTVNQSLDSLPEAIMSYTRP